MVQITEGKGFRNCGVTIKNPCCSLAVRIWGIINTGKNVLFGLQGCDGTKEKETPGPTFQD